jgi:hypothetical protein
MKLTPWIKALLMALVGFLATTLADLESFNFSYVAIATAAFTLIYVAKNAVWPSDSPIGLNVRDLISGVVVAVGMAISSFAASIITTGVVDWKALGIAVFGAVVGYFTKTATSKA